MYPAKKTRHSIGPPPKMSPRQACLRMSFDSARLELRLIYIFDHDVSPMSAGGYDWWFGVVNLERERFIRLEVSGAAPAAAAVERVVIVARVLGWKLVYYTTLFTSSNIYASSSLPYTHETPKTPQTLKTRSKIFTRNTLSYPSRRPPLSHTPTTA